MSISTGTFAFSPAARKGAASTAVPTASLSSPLITWLAAASSFSIGSSAA